MQIGALIRRAALYYGPEDCLVEGDRVISFDEFNDATDRLGNALLAQGLQPGDRVGVLLPNGIDCLVTYYALAKSGLVRVSLNTRETLEDHKYKLEDSGSRCVICGDEESVPELECVIREHELLRMIAQGDARPCVVDRDLEEPYRLGYTGGTTGRPKAVTLTMRGEGAELSAFLVDLVPSLGRGDTFLHAAPIAHASGAFFLPALVRGARSLVMKKFDPNDFIELADSKQPTMTFLVPTMLAMILEQLPPRHITSFTRIIYGASPIAEALLSRAEDRFGRVFAQVYGQAESPMVITCLKPEDHDRVGSCGRPFTTVEAGIMNDEGDFLPTGEVGEIVCRGTQLMSRYWNRPEATREAMRYGWLHTGDLGKMDEDGFFYILDRKNDMLISGGYNVYPREVEDALLGCDGVLEAAVIGLPDEKWGDRVHAVVAGREGLDPEAVLHEIRTHLASYKQPKAVEVWGELPKSAANKILRRTVRDRVLAHQMEGHAVEGRRDG